MVFILIFVIVIFVLIAFFAGFNLQNVCDIWFFGKTFDKVPVFITVLVSFAAGIVATLPAVFFRHTKKLSPEQARAQAERLEQQQKKQIERQLKMQKRLEEAKARSQKAFGKKSRFANASPKTETHSESDAAKNSSQEENK